MRVRTVISLLLLVPLVPLMPLLARSSAAAQTMAEGTGTRPLPSVSVSASGDAKVPPDRASLRVSVQTHATTAAAAASQNATRQTAVLSALRAVGLTNDQLSTADYTVSPEYRYEQNKSPTLTGYTVTNTVVADVHDVASVGKVLDAALGSGANVVSSLDFYASNTDAARRQAISAAVARAHAEADAAARAAGGTLGPLLSLQIDGNQPTPPRPMMRMAASSAQSESTPSPINPGQQTLTVSVSARWQYTAGH